MPTKNDLHFRMNFTGKIKCRFNFYFLLAVCLLSATQNADAANHTIYFGGSYGYSYSPGSLNVSLGDIITWEGDFYDHPFASASIPPGAAAFSNEDGNSFSYTVTVAGIYQYECTAHNTDGMTGSFTASSINSITENYTHAVTNIFPAVTDDMIFIHAECCHPPGKQIYVQVYSIAGHLLINDIILPGEKAGIHLASFISGIYLAAIRNENELLALKKIIKK